MPIASGADRGQLFVKCTIAVHPNGTASRIKAESNALSRQLVAKSVTPEECMFRLVHTGPSGQRGQPIGCPCVL